MSIPDSISAQINILEYGDLGMHSPFPANCIRKLKPTFPIISPSTCNKYVPRLLTRPNKFQFLNALLIWRTDRPSVTRNVTAAPVSSKKGQETKCDGKQRFTAVFVSQGRKPVSQETMRIRARSFLRFLNNLMEKIWYLPNIKKHIKFRSLPF